MAKKKNNVVLKGIVWVCAIAGLFVVLMAVLSPSRYVTGSIVEEETSRVGQQSTLIYNVKNVPKGQNVSWYVDGKLQKTEPFDGEKITMNFTPEKTGTTRIKVETGNYVKSQNIKIHKPLYTFEIPNVTVTYGDEPEIAIKTNCDFITPEYEVIGYDGNAGCYNVDFKEKVYLDEYDVKYVVGKLTVLPKELTVNSIERVYDGESRFAVEDFETEGLLEGDRVCINGTRVILDDKNVGEHVGRLEQAELVGEDACNYTVSNYVTVNVLPKDISIENVSAENKQYDGTAKATVKCAGKLVGVVEGDNVAVGSIDVKFDGVDVGEHQLVVDNVTLVGIDKENYNVTDVTTTKSKITESIWNKITSDDSVNS